MCFWVSVLSLSEKQTEQMTKLNAKNRYPKEKTHIHPKAHKRRNESTIKI